MQLQPHQFVSLPPSSDAVVEGDAGDHGGGDTPLLRPVPRHRGQRRRPRILLRQKLHKELSVGCGCMTLVVWVISHLVPKERGREIIDYDWDKRTALALPESSSLILPILRHVILLGAATLSHL